MDILIVDNDKLIREGLKKIIANHFDETIVIHERANGLQALECVCAQQIDIIVTDIKMPMCSGIELIEKLRVMEYQGQIIVLSGFDEYALVRSAMRMGALDYLLKPVIPDELASLIRNAIQKIKESEYKTHILLEKRVRNIVESMYSQQLILDMLLEEVEPQTVILAKYLDTIGITNHTAILLYLVNLSGGHHKKKEAAMLFHEIENIFEHVFDESYALLQGKMKQAWIVVVISKSEIDRERVSWFETGLMEQKIEYEHENQMCTMGSIKENYDAYLSKMETKFYSMESGATAVELDTESLIADIIKSASGLDEKKLEYHIKRYCQNANKVKKPSLDLKKELIKMINQISYANLAYIAVLGKYKFTQYDITNGISSANTVIEVQNNLLEMFSLYINEIKSKKAASHDELIEKVKAIVEKEYMEDITLQDISNRLFIHPNYLSKVFGERVGINFRDYLRHFRVEQAKLLIQQGQSKIYEISGYVGYNDIAHFNRAFKSVTGISPSEYKKSI